MPALSFEQIREKLAARFPDVVGPTVAAKDPFVVVKGEQIAEIGRFLRDDPELAFDYLIDTTGVDYPKENLIRVVYHVQSLSLKHTFKLKVECPRASPKVPTVDGVWHAANWLEREVYDLLGVEFEGHPDLRRIMLPDDWVGHPLRKDWQEFGGYHGVSNVRESPLDRLLEQDKVARAALPKPAPAPAAAPAAKAAAAPVAVAAKVPAVAAASEAPAPAPAAPSAATQALASAAIPTVEAAQPAAPVPTKPPEPKQAEVQPAQATPSEPPKAS